MQIRDNASPRGRDVGPVQLYPIMSQLPRTFTGGAQEGMTMHRLTELRMEAKKAGRLIIAIARAVPEPYHRTCGHCGEAFDTNISTQTYCSTKCRKAANHKRNDKWVPRVRTHSGPLPKPVTCGHPERKHRAKGMCAYCYNKQWEATR